MKFLEKNHITIFAFIILLICLFAPIMRPEINESVKQTLGYIITCCLVFLLRGNIN